MIRVLIAEDSPTVRRLLVEILRSDPEVEVVGQAADGAAAVDMTMRLRPDVVTMDIRMPKLDGFEATRRIMVDAPTPIVIVSAALDVRGVEVSMNALKAGALSVLPTPRGVGTTEFHDEARHFLDTVKAMSQVKVVRRWYERARSESLPALVSSGARPRVVAIAASTGGPAALARILSEVPGDFPLPVLVVQHISRGFVGGFAAWLNTTASLRVKIAEHGEPLCARTVYLPPDDCHLGAADRFTVIVSSDPPIDGFRPSATYLFETVARAFGNSAIAVIMTGMGSDGVTGLRAIRETGGRVLAQDEKSSVVFGMPGAAVAEGLVDATLPLEAMALRLREMAGP